ncbi:centriole, cilia and spindle-associated protein [Chanos chanos]|uniref:Centriole, cilia and spindle-associated protein n=1 Tax=Chanos chanos TaxID=29144 RepID=A0A6J2V8W6_CHACN|nr:centriole, cilia and spindle-associated protein-like [Chanos chanos]
MVTKRIRSEYMKKFKDPKWETYAKCYEELLKYRLTRRLLEQTHNPWFWEGGGSDTESSGKSTPLGRNKVEPLRSKDDTPPRHAKETESPAGIPNTAPEVNAGEREVEVAAPATCSVIAPEGPEPDNQERGEETNREEPLITDPETEPSSQSKPKSKPRHSRKPSRLKAHVHTIKDTDKENRHPFALYGSGERQADMASKKTHNVCPAASTSEIHESALRAKTRREVEKQMKRTDKRQPRSVDREKMNRTKLVSEYDPWMTEYMRCFSARSE